TVTPCWCYGSETMDMDPLTVKAVWGFNGTDRPGAVYLAAVLAAHNQKGLPAFGIYGHDVQDLKDTEVLPADVADKIYSDAEFRRALDWVKANCKEGPDNNAPDAQHSRERKDKAWATSVKM